MIPKYLACPLKSYKIGMSSIFMTEDNNVFQEVWRERLETHGEQEGLLLCAVASPGEFALMRSFFRGYGSIPNMDSHTS